MPRLRLPTLVLAAAVALLALAACGLRRAPPVELAPGERLVIDVRDPHAFAAGHHAGALNIQLGWDQLQARTPAYVPDRSTALAVRAADEGELAAALRVLASLGYRDVAVAASDGETQTLTLWSAEQLRAELAGPQPPIVLDVRSRLEFLLRPAGIEGEIRLDQDAAPGAVETLDRDARYAVLCEIGWRSSQLAGWMRRRGFRDVVNVVEGLDGWRRLPDGPR